MEDLDRDLALVLVVAGEPDGGHPTAADLAFDRVSLTNDDSAQAGHARRVRVRGPDVRKLMADRRGAEVVG